jgi:hypothetical protein
MTRVGVARVLEAVRLRLVVRAQLSTDADVGTGLSSGTLCSRRGGKQHFLGGFYQLKAHLQSTIWG